MKEVGTEDPGTPAKRVDCVAQPLPKLKAQTEGDVLSVNVPAHGIASVMAG